VRRTLLVFVASAFCAGPCRAEQTLSASETLIRLVVAPAQAPKPALRYLLLPEMSEMNPGNPIHNYLKCCMEQHAFLYDKKSLDRCEKLLATPLRELPVQDVQDFGRAVLGQADWAARLDKPDWQIMLKLKTDGINLLLPDVQGMRALARALQVRFRGEVALGRIDDGIRTAKTIFAMARHLGEHPTVIGNLVGIAIANIGIQPLEEMLEQPGCPNFYWALTNLPSPLVSTEKGLAGEREITHVEFRDLDQSAPMSVEQLARFIAHMEKVLGDVGKPFGIKAWLNARSKDEWMVRGARLRLLDHGLPEGHLLLFPAEQVLLLDEKREFEVRTDESIKLMTLPPWYVESLATQAERTKKPALFADALVPALSAVRRAQARLTQRIALLRHVEALRLYAAAHHDTLPAKLSDVSVLLPDDPFTGKPFRYEIDGSTAHLRGTPPPGEEKNFGFNVHYEITLRN
jgi:hypothetical protein